MSHGRNPGYIKGDNWIVCAVCEKHVRASEAKRRWDGLIVCVDDFEQRHPMDYMRVKPDSLAIKGIVRPEPADSFIDGGAVTSALPTPTFDNTED